VAVVQVGPCVVAGGGAAVMMVVVVGLSSAVVCRWALDAGRPVAGPHAPAGTVDIWMLYVDMLFD
jgi:hypothetical protein